jgi:hypothetical protein
VPEDLTTQDRPVGPTPAPPLVRAPAAPSASRHPWRRAVLLALLVLVAGAGLGAAGFAAEQRLLVWRPVVTELSGGGWRVTGSAGLRPAVPSIAAGRVAWNQGSYTCLMDLASGDTKVIGAAARGSALWSPALDERTVVWLESPNNGAEDETRLWIYDIERGRRVDYRLGGGAEAPVVAGDLVVWPDVSRSGVPEIAALDLKTGGRSVIAEGNAIFPTVVAGEDAFCWLVQPSESRSQSVVVRDLRTTTDTTVPLAADGSGLTVTDIHMGGRTLLWALQSSTTTRVVTFDLDTHATKVVVQGTIVQSPATDGTVVVWAARDASSGSCIVRGRRLDDGAAGVEFEVGRPATWPTSLAVDGEWVAWSFDDGSWSYLEIVKAVP